MGELAKVIAFNYESMNLDVRVVMIDGEPWFVASDVCRVLGIDTSLAVNGRTRRNEYGTAQQSGGLDDDEKGTAIVSTPGGTQEVLIVSEPGFYSLIMKSRKSEAKAFKRWVTHEVLPSIRKTGEYSIKDKTPQTYIESLESLLQSEKEKLRLQQKMQEQQPKVEAYNVLLSGQNAQTMAQVAKSFGTGRNRLFELLRNRKVLMKNNLPYQEYLDRGFFEVREVSTKRKELTVNVTQTLVTAKGIELIRKFLSEEIY